MYAKQRQPMDQQTQHQQQGAALISVLWLSVVLTLIATTMTAQQRNQIDTVRQQQSQLSAHHALAGAEQWLLYQILTNNISTRHPELALPQPWQFNGHQISLQLQPEDHRMNLNFAQSAALMQLLNALHLALPEQQTLADRIMDWRDRDDLLRPQGAEAAEYAAHNQAEPPANRPFAHISELQQVLGLSPTLAWQMQPFVSLHSRAGRVNPLLLQALQQQDPLDPMDDLPVTKALLGGSPALSNTWHLQLDAWRDGQFIAALDSVQRQRAIAVTRPFATLSWQLQGHPVNAPLTTVGMPDPHR